MAYRSRFKLPEKAWAGICRVSALVNRRLQRAIVLGSGPGSLCDSLKAELMREQGRDKGAAGKDQHRDHEFHREILTWFCGIASTRETRPSKAWQRRLDLRFCSSDASS